MRRWILGLLACTVACDTSRVRWEEPQAAPADTGKLEIADDGRVAYSSPERFRPAPDSSICPGSQVFVNEGIDAWYSAWLRLRPDSTVRVMAAYWDGAFWKQAATVDSLDVGKFGCRRPAPSIAVSDDGSVHVAYSIKAPEGYGVFFGHSMDRGRTFHDPMIIVYGDRLSATAIASSGSRVAIAYEDPSGSVKRIDVALSNTQGHTFEPREHGSPGEMTAIRPRIAIRDTIIALSFAGADSSQRALRIGHLRK